MVSTLVTPCTALPPEEAHFVLGRPGDETIASDDSDALLDERSLSKLKWRCRRGLLENDLFIEKFFARHESGLTVGQAQGLNELMDLSDNDLLDLLLRRKEPTDAVHTIQVRKVLAMLRV